MPGGRPTKYKPEYAEKAKELCSRGATDAELATFFEVATSTVALWKVQYKEFSDALKASKDELDAKVEQSLFRRAMGYEYDEISLKEVDGNLVEARQRKVFPPDTTAMIFWLKNRQPAKWRDRVDQTISGPDGGPVQVQRIELVAFEQRKDKSS
jgi:hypothetical protein